MKPRIATLDGIYILDQKTGFYEPELEEPHRYPLCERSRKAYAQPDMFIERAPEPKREALW